VKRRDFITLLGGAGAAWPLAGRAQQPAKLPSIGFLVSGTPSTHGQWFAALVQRLRELGWIEGRTITIEYRWAAGSSERAAEIAAEFVRLKVDRLCGRCRRSRQRHRREPGSTKRKPHRPLGPIHRSCRQAPRTFTRDSSRFASLGDPNQYRQFRRHAGGVRGCRNGSLSRPGGRHARRPAARGCRDRVRIAQGSCGRFLCHFRSAHKHEPDSH
jgi:hypothetical protein